MSKATKKPDLRLRALYVTPSRTRPVQVSPKGNRVSVGDESWKVTRAHIFPPGAPFDVILPQGQSEAVPVERPAPVSSYEYDGAAETDFLRQINTLARGAQAHKSSWWVLGMQAVILLALIIVTVVTNGNISDLADAIQASHVPGQGAGDDSTVYRPGG